MKKLALVLLLALWPQQWRIPEFFFPPRLAARGPEVRVTVQPVPFEVRVEGEARIERLDGYRVRLTTRNPNLAIHLESGEAIYGLTERIVASRRDSETRPREVGGIDRRGEIVTMWVLPSEAGYAPFYHSSRGYGMVVEGTWPGVYDIGKTDREVLRVGWEQGPEGFSCVFIAGSHLEILDRYTAMTGRPILPPRWVYAPWKWRDEHAAGVFDTLDGVTINAQVAEDIKQYERLGFPVGVYMIDRPWAPGEYGYGRFEWDENRFPHGDAMVALLHARGWRVIMWGAPWALGDRPGDQGAEARARGLLIGDRNLDYTNPAAVAWHRGQLEGWLRRTGIDGWKLDRGDEYNPSHRHDIYHDGRNGLQVHNDYVRMYVKTYYDATRAVRGDDFVLKARPAYTGTTAWSITYGGDTPGALDLGLGRGTDLGLRGVIISLQRMAFMGYPTWGSDTGGYEGFKDRDVFARWLQFSCFCPLMEIGGVGEHEPWAMPTEPAYDEEMIRIYRRYTQLHARLLDYTYALARRAHETGSPIVHPLVMDWPADPRVKDRWDEYMYGPALLVAPVWKNGERSRPVYLPAGRWVDFWERGRVIEGPADLRAPAPLDRIPLYIRAEMIDQVPPAD